jgi:hypothetical protein
MKRRTLRKPVNTAVVSESDRAAFLSSGISIGPEGAILAQERAGQMSFVQSDTLPTRMLCNAQSVLEAAGVEFLFPVEDDPVFQYVELPPGWERVATDDPMWSDILDDNGVVRARVFYKAAFYDRHSHLCLPE